MKTAKLIIINGPCGIGKSTVASALHDSMPLSYLVDIDAISRNISHYREYRAERWEIRETVAQAIIRALISVNRDVIVDKMMFDQKILNDYHSIAKEHKAGTHEIILWAPKDVVMKRADDRGWRENGLLTPEKCEIFWDKIDALKNARPKATVIDVTDMNPDEVLQAMQSLVQ
jgi:broad-specificity NMP kinase